MSQTKVYTVRRAEHLSSVDVKDINNNFWNPANVINDFSYPWETPSLMPLMTFKAVYDHQWLYWKFEVNDSDIKVHVDKNDKTEVVYGDRVEIFFSSDQALKSYYCLEIDPLGRVYDYEASHYRKFNSTWQWPDGQLGINARQLATGYEVTGMISLKSLKELNLLNDGQLQCGLYRGKCVEINIEKEAMKWISWVKPVSPTPDFHIPSSFGQLVFEK
jgi:hypothetical protein